MKTIKAIKPTKNVEVGTIKRINERDADSEVRGGYWQYVPKSEWKSMKRGDETPQEPKVETKKQKKNEKNSK